MISRKKATVSIRLDHVSKMRKNGTLSILLRITYCRKSKYISLGYTATKNDFEKIYNGNVRGELKKLKTILQRIESKVNDIIESLDTFSFSLFEARLFRPQSSKNNVFQYLKNEADQARTIKSKGVAIGSIKSFLNFCKRNDLTFEDISVSWLKGYEKYMLSNGKSPTTVGIYLRTLRVVYNKAINDGITSRELYPFGKGKYAIPTSRNIKKAIDKDDLAQLYYYNPTLGSKEDWAKDMWFFIFLCNGINPKDVALLKYKNLDSDSIIFYRAKTSNTRKLQKPILVPLDNEMNQIIDKWGNKPVDTSKYIFNNLKPGLTPEQIDSRIHDFYSDSNEYMKKICEKVGITNKITTITARHTYATFMMRNGAPIELISENMGHTNAVTTKNYLASFELEVKRDWNSKLLDF